MKSKSTWGFTVPATAVDLQRVLDEALKACPEKEAIKLTLNSHVYTLSCRRFVERRALVSSSIGCLSDASKVSIFGKDAQLYGLAPVRGSKLGFSNIIDLPTDVLVFEGDRVRDIVAAVVVAVEVF